ncbi:hypothetical protein DAPPUDRAFT_320763 [Daphnia pulex]|uniref:E3 ubiquitin ligase UBR4 C-terminal domain-containing protein n=1 Tax=Daphnia pulex TaxID=6669 RepID=E9GR06_DAPPU|nr:hypothetical protein DAPPUDRAFT_320763 [Daphnia pulex]|eukprot:EFX77927.1 hypothetical protein DAPPUDRAFT_320763 [Daphnia pulex]
MTQSNFIPNIVKAMKYAQNGPVFYEEMNKGFPKSVNFYKVIAHSYENVTVDDIDADRPGTVANYIRRNDEAVFMATDKLLNAYQNDFLNCGSFDEFFCDVAGLLEDIPSPDEFIRDLLQVIP